MTTRGLKEEEFEFIGKIISDVLKNNNNQETLEVCSEKVLTLTKKFPIYRK